MFEGFWERNRKKDELKENASVKLSNVEISICHMKYANIDIRRAVLDWRDKHTENVEMHLSCELTRLYGVLDEQILKMSLYNILNLKKYVKECIEPIFKDWVEQEVIYLVSAAQDDISAIFTHALEFGHQDATLNHDGNSDHYSDAAIATAATGAGLTAIPVVATFSITSVGGIMGFLGFTTLAWPVIITGMALILPLLALGGYKAFGLKSRAISKFRKNTRNAIEEQVLGYGSEKDSIRKKLQFHIEETAKKIIMEID